MPFKKLPYVMLTLVLFLFAGCSVGGDDFTDISSNTGDIGDFSGVLALSVAERVTVVDAKDSSVASSAVKGEEVPVTAESGGDLSAELYPGDIPANTPWYTDGTRIWVAERSSEVFDSVNSLLCLVSNLQYEAMVNRGDYVAQMDMSKCEDQTDASGRLQEGGGTSGSDMPNYTRWVINSSRADATSPHIVKAWIEFDANEGGGDGEGFGGMVFVLMTITESKSDSNPLGIFRLDYGGHPFLPDGVTLDTSTWIMRGFIETVRDSNGDVLLNYASDESQGTDIRIQQAVLNRDEDSGTGVGSVYAYEAHDEGGVPYVSEGGYDFSYNDTHFLRGLYDSATYPVYNSEACFSRYFFEDRVHKYGLYNATGQRVEHDSGMIVKYNDGSTDYYGWISYHGMWFPDQVAIVNGLTVYSQEYDKATGTLIENEYETFVSGGKLIKYTQGTVQLQDIGNVPLNWSDDTSGTWTSYIAIWNPSTQTFQKTAIVDYSNGTTQDIPDVDIDLAWFFANYYYYSVSFWSDSLGGSLRVDLMDPTTGDFIPPTNSTWAITYNASVVYPGSEDPDLETYGLACFDRCLDPTPGVINSTDPFHTKSTDGTINQQAFVLPVGYAPNLVNAVTYSFNSSRMQLVDDKTGLDVILNGPSLHTGYNGIQGGAMIVNTPANLDLLKCSDNVSDFLCAWKLWDNSPEFYVWETGTDQWNRLSAIKNAVSGDFVSFEPPIKVEYVHIATDSNKPDYKYNGSKFFLEYYGFGDLSGIPGECVDPDTGDPVECGSGTWWAPSFSIPTGTELINIETSEPYLAKAIEKEQKMTQTSTMLPCQLPGFDLTHYLLPDIATDWQDPLIGTMPTVTEPPKVIDGELQGVSQ